MNEVLDYKSSGVDVKAGEEAVKRIKGLVRKSYTKDVLSELGSFGGLYRFDPKEHREPVLVSSTDGVGTKILVAIRAGRFDTVGQDLVNHCVNDILVQGAKPLFFLDYIGLSGMNVDMVESVISGLVKACVENSCTLIGGEMAEMPGIYHDGDFDLAGTIVGVVDREHLIPRNICPGDVVLGLPSTGLHTNGYSLARKIVFDKLHLDVDSHIPELGMTIADALLSIHRSYLPYLSRYLRNAELHGLAHITGGGIFGNLKRIIPEGLFAEIVLPEDRILPVFKWLEGSGKISREDMLEAFNMGVGMIVVVARSLADVILDDGVAFVLGSIKENDGNMKIVEFRK